MADKQKPDDEDVATVGSDLFGRWADDEQHQPPITAEPAGRSPSGTDEPAGEDTSTR